jgi:alkylation response protein AidB-like acyl-CoA dehydrogenase
MDAADMQATEDREADFGAFVGKSQLPLMLREAQRAGLRLVFVRVQRRPAGGRPPHQSPALQRYVRELRAFIEANGGLLLDDTGDPAQTLDWYEDGDHLSREGRRRYTERFAERIRLQLP